MSWQTLATTLNDQHRLGRICQGLVAAFRAVGITDRALTYSLRSHAIATTLGDMGLEIASTLRLGSVYYDLGDYHQAMAYLKRNVTSLQGELLYERFGGNLSNALPAIDARTYLVLCLTKVGGFAEGIAYGDEALQLADVIDRPYERASALTRVGE
jgi:tetratricopeptide (TPR) repeat protein